MKFAATLLIFFGATVFASAPDIKTLASQIPGGKLQLEFVLKLAIQKSSTFKALQATAFESEATLLGSQERYDWTLLADYSYTDQDKDTLTPFEPGKIKKDNYSLGVRKNFLTGTAFETKWGRSFNQIKFRDPTIQVPNYEDALSFSLKQSLWADAFGVSSRSQLQADKLTSQSLGHQYKINLQNWALNLIDLYHRAWFSQRQVIAAQESVARRKRLLGVTQSKFQKGTTEKQDYLQIQAASLSTENQLSQADAALNEVWRYLVISLDLPDSFLLIPADKVPMGLSDNSERVFDLCSRPVDYTKTFEVLKAEADKKSSEELLNSSSHQDNPKLELVAGYNTNGIASSQNRAQRENIEQDFPSWNIGLQLEMPLGQSGSKARKLRALSNELKSRTSFQTVLDEKKIEVLTACEKLKKAKAELQNSETSFKNQQERLELEEKRFRLGRTSTFSVIQAGDDKSQSEINYNQAQVDYRAASWKVLSATSQLYQIVEDWKKQL